jgi:hypothetical protein
MPISMNTAVTYRASIDDIAFPGRPSDSVPDSAADLI